MAADTLEEGDSLTDDLVDVDGWVEADFGSALRIDCLEGEKDA